MREPPLSLAHSERLLPLSHCCLSEAEHSFSAESEFIGRIQIKLLNIVAKGNEEVISDCSRLS